MIDWLLTGEVVLFTVVLLLVLDVITGVCEWENKIYPPVNPTISTRMAIMPIKVWLGSYILGFGSRLNI